MQKLIPHKANPLAVVFGGHGFIGRYIVRRLAQQGVQVRVASRHPSAAQFLRTAGVVGQVVPVYANLADADTLAAVIDGADIVINSVGILAEQGANNFDIIHGQAPGLIASLASKAGAAKFLHISALGADRSSKSHYARSKAAGEEAVRAAFPGAQILRPSLVFGPEDGFFNLFAKIARLSPVMPLIGGGHSLFQPVYVGDVADAALAALAAPGGAIFELGGPEQLSFRALLEKMAQHIDRNPIYLPVPWPIARIQAWFLEKLPGQLLTRDQLLLLQQDNILSGQDGLQRLGITPTPMDLILPTYLDQYRPGGRFNRAA